MSIETSFKHDASAISKTVFIDFFSIHDSFLGLVLPGFNQYLEDRKKEVSHRDVIHIRTYT